MKLRTLKLYLVAFLCIFAILERSGISMVSICIPDKNQVIELIQSDTESNSKDFEKLKEAPPIHEFWTVFNKHRSLIPLFKYLSIIYDQGDGHKHLAYSASVPTPPPDYS